MAAEPRCVDVSELTLPPQNYAKRKRASLDFPPLLGGAEDPLLRRARMDAVAQWTAVRAGIDRALLTRNIESIRRVEEFVTDSVRSRTSQNFALEIPTAMILGDIQYSSLVSQLTRKKNFRIAVLRQINAGDLKSAVKSMIYQFVNGSPNAAVVQEVVISDENGLQPSNELDGDDEEEEIDAESSFTAHRRKRGLPYDMRVLEDWFAHERKSLREGASLIVLLPEFESFDNAVFQELARIIRHVQSLFDLGKYEEAQSLIDDDNYLWKILLNSKLELKRYHQLQPFAIEFLQETKNVVKLNKALSVFQLYSRILRSTEFLKEPLILEILKRLRLLKPNELRVILNSWKECFLKMPSDLRGAELESVQSLLDELASRYDRDSSDSESSDDERRFLAPETKKRQTKASLKAGFVIDEMSFTFFTLRVCKLFEDFVREPTRHHTEFLFNEIYYFHDYKLLMKEQALHQVEKPIHKKKLSIEALFCNPPQLPPPGPRPPSEHVSAEVAPKLFQSPAFDTVTKNALDAVLALAQPSHIRGSNTAADAQKAPRESSETARACNINADASAALGQQPELYQFASQKLLAGPCTFRSESPYPDNIDDVLSASTRDSPPASAPKTHAGDIFGFGGSTASQTNPSPTKPDSQEGTISNGPLSSAKPRPKNLFEIRNMNAQSKQAFSAMMQRMGAECKMRFDEERRIWTTDDALAVREPALPVPAAENRGMVSEESENNEDFEFDAEFGELEAVDAAINSFAEIEIPVLGQKESISKAAAAEKHEDANEKREPSKVRSHIERILPDPLARTRAFELNLDNAGLEDVCNMNVLVPNLVRLSMSKNRVIYLDELPHSLTTLVIRANRLSNITSFSHLRAMQYLDISFNNVADLNVLKTLSNLRELNISGNCLSVLEITDSCCLSVFEYSSLRSLDASKNQLHTVLISEDGAKNLQSLYIGHKLFGNYMVNITCCHVKQRICMAPVVSPFDTLPRQVEYLYLHGQAVLHQSDENPELCFRGQNFSKRIRCLDISGTTISSMDILDRLEALQTLSAINCGIEHIPDTFAKGMRYLKVLKLAFNHVDLFSETTIGALRLLTYLEILDLRGNPITRAFYADTLPRLPKAVELSIKSSTLADTADDTGASGWKAVDKEFRKTLSDRDFVRRQIYRRSVLSGCEKLAVLDGLLASPKEREKSKKFAKIVQRWKFKDD
ncbi:hypothetical protein HDU84_003426 [Entophlyctis sp. JEL0112]|nr:hypothetical protein HDU84_003426 [Entophlyctis sp. JEL0112]